jgi:hypothetical protein
MPRSPRIQDRAILSGFDDHGDQVFELQLALDSYWDNLHPVIDDSSFRRARCIRRLVGKLYGSAGELLQEFKNTYDPSGVLVSSYVRHDDGTETRFP